MSTQELAHIESKKGRITKQRCLCTNVPFGELCTSNSLENTSSYSQASSKLISIEERWDLNSFHAGSSANDGQVSVSDKLFSSKSPNELRKQSNLVVLKDINTGLVADDKKLRQKLLGKCNSSQIIEDLSKSDILLPEWTANIIVKDLVKDIISSSVPEISKLDFTTKKQTVDRLNDRNNSKLRSRTLIDRKVEKHSIRIKKDATTLQHQNVIKEHKKKVTRLKNNAKLVIGNVNVQGFRKTQPYDETDETEANKSGESLTEDDCSLYRSVLRVPMNSEVGEHFENNDNPLLNYNYLYQRLKKIQQGMQQDLISVEDFNYGTSTSNDFHYIKERLRRIKESREKMSRDNDLIKTKQHIF